MDINAVSRTVPAAGIAEPAHIDQGSERRDVVHAVRAVNATDMFGPENELRFQVDPHSRRLVVRVVNKKTDEEVSQIPAEYVLNLAADLPISEGGR